MVNQFFGAHNSTFVYDSAVLQASQTIGAATYLTTQDQYISQSFMTGASQTAIGEVWLQVSVVGGSAITDNVAPLFVGIYADSGGEPAGSPLAVSFLTETAIYAAPFWVIFPLAVSGLTPSTTYHLVTYPVGTATSYYVWQENNQTGGASTTPDFILWTDQPFGMMYQIYDQTAAFGSLLKYVIVDEGSQWIQYTYDGNKLLSTITQYTVNQLGTGSISSTWTLTYSNGQLTGIS